MTPPLRNEWLDVFRGLAAVAVTVYHANGPVPAAGNWYHAAATNGWLGVAVFFVLSGYCIHDAAVRSRSAGPFVWRRLARIYPPYWASLVVVALVVVGRKVVVGVNDRAVLPDDAGGWAATATAMVFPATRTPGLNWVYWSLAYELVFYAITAAAAVRPRLFPWLTVALAAAAVWPWPDATAPTVHPWSVSGLATLPGLFFLSHWPIYGVGVGVSLAGRGERRAAAAVLLACGAAVAVRFAPTVGAVVGLTAAAVAASVRSPQVPVPVRRAIVPLGTVSYSLYLTHVPIGCWLLLGGKTGAWADDPWRNVLYDAGVTAACLAVAGLMYMAVERPSLRLGRRPVGAPRSIGARPDEPAAGGRVPAPLS